VSRSGHLTQIAVLARRAMLKTLRQPFQLFPIVFFPVILLAVNASGLRAATRLPGFPTHSYISFAIAGASADWQKPCSALATLDRKYREVFVLRDMEHLNIQETAETLGISVASVKTRLLRARLMLRDLLAAGWQQGWFSRLPFEKGNKPW